MNKVYDKAMSAIEKIEEVMKKGGKRKENTHTMSLLVFICISLSSFLYPLSSHAVTKAEADSAYMHNEYQKAIDG